MANWQQTPFDRRALLGTSLLGASLAISVGVRAGIVGPAHGRVTLPDLARDVATFVAFGEHRAGTQAEQRTARWLLRRLHRLGYQTEQQKFPIHTLLDPGGFLLTGGTKTAIFPQWLPAKEAISAPITAPLVALDAPAGPPSIRLLTRPAQLSANWTEPLQAHVRDAAAKGASALVMAINDPSDDLFVCNQHHHEPLEIPVALVARRSLPMLGAGIGSSATLQVSGRFADTKAINVFGRKSGKGKMIVISTPLTGWFRCGGERGPGIALWLRMAAILAKQERPVLMLGTGSHEIGHLGMAHALQHGAPAPDDVEMWIHFGASLAATKLDKIHGYKSGQYLVGTEITAELAQKHLGKVMPFYVPGTAATLGEAGQVIGSGHQRFVGMSGQFPTFHTPLDRGEAIDFVQLERIAEQALALIGNSAGPGSGNPG